MYWILKKDSYECDNIDFVSPVINEVYYENRSTDISLCS